VSHSNDLKKGFQKRSQKGTRSMDNQKKKGKKNLKFRSAESLKGRGNQDRRMKNPNTKNLHENCREVDTVTKVSNTKENEEVMSFFIKNPTGSQNQKIVTRRNPVCKKFRGG